MKNNRRDFLKWTSFAGFSISGLDFLNRIDPVKTDVFKPGFGNTTFNMSGYQAPKLEKVRVGVIGLGMRGPEAVTRLSFIEGVEIVAICDLHENRTQAVLKSLEGSNHRPTLYSGSSFAWKKVCERKDIDLIYIATPWEWHTPMAVFAMEHEKHAAVEVPAARTLEECWQLVETSERTKRHCMMLENCCYDFFELLTLNMVRQGYFGEVVHGEGAYIHNLIDLNFNKKTGYEGMWRLKENATRNGNLYPTHGLGPICQIMNINRGDQMDYLTSLSSRDFNMSEHATKLASEDSFYNEFANSNYRGNMNTTLVKTHQGRSIMIQHDISSPRPYSRIHLVSGSKAMARKYPAPAQISSGHTWIKADEMKEVEEKYTPDLVKKVGELAKQIGGHGGMDFIMDWRLIDCLRNGIALDQDVYDAALWSAVAPLSEASVANRSNSIDVPDFTRGFWKTNTPVSLDLGQAGNTGVNLWKKTNAKN